MMLRRMGLVLIVIDIILLFTQWYPSTGVTFLELTIKATPCLLRDEFQIAGLFQKGMFPVRLSGVFRTAIGLERSMWRFWWGYGCYGRMLLYLQDFGSLNAAPDWLLVPKNNCFNNLGRPNHLNYFQICVSYFCIFRRFSYSILTSSRDVIWTFHG